MNKVIDFPDKKPRRFNEGTFTTYIDKDSALDISVYGDKMYISEDGESKYEGPPFKTIRFAPYPDAGDETK